MLINTRFCGKMANRPCECLTLQRRYWYCILPMNVNMYVFVRNGVHNILLIFFHICFSSCFQVQS